MKMGDFKGRLKAVPIICVLVACFAIMYGIILKMGLWDIDFKAIDERFIKQNVVEISKLNAKNSVIPKTQDDGNGEIDINYATADELDTLPGIGQTRAGAIAEQRIKMGGFSTLKDIICTNGIGIGIYKKIEPYIKISEYKGND